MTTAAAMRDEDLLTYQDLVKRWKLDISTVKRHCRKIKKFAPSQRTIRFHPRLVDRFEKQHSFVSVLRKKSA